MQLVLQDAGGERYGILRRDRAVGFHCQQQLVVVGDLAYAGRGDGVGHAADRRVDAVHRDQTDRRVFRAVDAGRLVALAQVDGELHAQLHPVVAGLDLTGAHFAGTGGGQRHPLRAFTVHPQRELLDVQHDIGHVFPHAGDAAEFVQHAVDLHRGHRRALQRGQQNAPDRVAQRHAEATLQRFGDDGGDAGRIRAWLDFQLFWLDQRLPISLDNCALPHVTPFEPRRGAAGPLDSVNPAYPTLGVESFRRAGACADGSRYAESASCRGPGRRRGCSCGCP